jgi:hypothetical protein
MPDHSLDWAYVDSSHAYDHTVQELALLDRKVRSGGVIAGDDWQPDPDHPIMASTAPSRSSSRRRLELRFADAGNRQWAISRRRWSTHHPQGLGRLPS